MVDPAAGLDQTLNLRPLRSKISYKHISRNLKYQVIS